MNQLSYRAMARLCAAVILLFSSQMAVAAIFMQIPGVPGESTTTGYEGWIVVNSWSQSASNVNAGPVLLPMTVTKDTDSSSPLLTQRVLEGTRIPEMRVHLVTTGTDGLETYMRLTLCDARIISMKYNSSGSRPQETITISADGYFLEYTPFNPDGTQGAPIQYSYNGCG